MQERWSLCKHCSLLCLCNYTHSCSYSCKMHFVEFYVIVRLCNCRNIIRVFTLFCNTYFNPIAWQFIAKIFLLARFFTLVFLIFRRSIKYKQTLRSWGGFPPQTFFMLSGVKVDRKQGFRAWFYCYIHTKMATRRTRSLVWSCALDELWLCNRNWRLHF